MSSSTETRRTGEEPVRCVWFIACEQLTDLEANHPILGWTPVCDGCARIVGIEPAPPAAGWRVRATWMEQGWQRTKTQAFMSPLKAKCLANVRFNIELWHPRAENLLLEVVSPVTNPGWGHGEWLETFKRGTT